MIQHIIPTLRSLWYLNDHASLMAPQSSNRKKLSLSDYFKSVNLIEITQKAKTAHELLICSAAMLNSHAM